MEGENMSIEEAAVYLGVSARTIQTWRNKGLLRWEYVARRVEINRADVLKLKATQATS